MKDRPLISAERQVTHLTERGVRFDIMSPEDAIAFLRDKNFFFKIKAFAKCFSRYRDPTSENYGRYVNLDFAYLAELTRLDHHLRELVLSITLDIEHYMKVHLNRAMMDDGADGKKVLDLLFAHERERKERLLEERFDPRRSSTAIERIGAIADHLGGANGAEQAKLLLEILHIAEDQTLGIDPEHLERSISYLGDSNYTRDLAKKYGRRENMYVWNYLELVSFGGIIALYKFYFYDLKKGQSKKAESVKQLLFPVKALRNAAAHNGNVMNTIGAAPPEARRRHRNGSEGGARNRPGARRPHEALPRRSRLHRARALLRQNRQRCRREVGEGGRPSRSTRALPRACRLL